MVNTIGSIYSNIKSIRQMSSVTGVKDSDFKILVQILEDSYFDKYHQSYFNYLENTKKEGLFTNYEEMLFLYLYCLKTGLTGDALSVTFGVSASLIKVKNRQIEGLLLSGLDKLGLVPIQKFEDVTKVVEFLEKNKIVIIDGVEHGKTRPCNEIEQKDKYSGKKKTYFKADNNQQ